MFRQPHYSFLSEAQRRRSLEDISRQSYVFRLDLVKFNIGLWII